MALLFRNRRNVLLYAAHAIYQPVACAGKGEFQVSHWFHIPANSERYVYGHTMGGPVFYSYGEWEDGGHTGGPRPIMVSNKAIVRCMHDVLLGYLVNFGEHKPVSPSNIVEFG